MIKIEMYSYLIDYFLNFRYIFRVQRQIKYRLLFLKPQWLKVFNIFNFKEY